MEVCFVDCETGSSLWSQQQPVWHDCTRRRHGRFEYKWWRKQFWSKQEDRWDDRLVMLREVKLALTQVNVDFIWWTSVTWFPLVILMLLVVPLASENIDQQFILQSTLSFSAKSRTDATTNDRFQSLTILRYRKAPPLCSFKDANSIHCRDNGFSQTTEMYTIKTHVHR